MATSTIIKDDRIDYYSRPNLLDNWYFIGGGSQLGGARLPINQRGATSYTGSGFKIDRWTSWSSNRKLELVSDGLKCGVTSDVGSERQVLLIQRVPKPSRLFGKPITASFLISELTVAKSWYIGIRTIDANGSVSLADIVWPDSPGLYTITRTYPLDSNITEIGIILTAASGSNSEGTGVHVGDYCKLKAVKLEIGNTQTLAHQENGTWVLNDIPNYQEELLKCQRYYIDLNPENVQYPDFATGNAYTATVIYPIINLPTSMVAQPSVSYTQSLRLSPGNLSVSDIYINMWMTNRLKVTVTSSGMTIGNEYTLGSATTGHLIFNAESTI